MRRFIKMLKLRKNISHVANDIFKRIFGDEWINILIHISRKYVHNGQIENNPTLVQIMAGYQTGDQPLSESIMA